MAHDLTDQEWLEAMALVEHLSSLQVSEGLKRLVDRELELLKDERCKIPENREIILYNVTILSAASSRMLEYHDIVSKAEELNNEMIKARESKKAKSKKSST